MRRVFSAAFSINPPSTHPLVALEKSTLASNEFGLILILLSGFPEAVGIPGLLDAVGLDAEEELVAVEEDKFITAGRDLDTTLSSFFFNVESSSPLWTSLSS